MTPSGSNIGMRLLLGLLAPVFVRFPRKDSGPATVSETRLVTTFAWQSVTVTVTELIPGQSVDPAGGDCVIVGNDGQQLFETVTGTSGTVQLVTVMLDGQLITGPV